MEQQTLVHVSNSHVVCNLWIGPGSARVREGSLAADALDFLHGATVVTRGSSKPQTLLQSLCSQKVLCNSLELHLHHRHVTCLITAILAMLKTMEQDRAMKGETRAKISGLDEQAKQLRTYFGLV